MKLVVVPAALAEFNYAAAFYTSKANVELGLAFVAEFERTANLITHEPFDRDNLSRHSTPPFTAQVSLHAVYQVTPDELRIIAVALTANVRVTGQVANKKLAMLGQQSRPRIHFTLAQAA